MTIKNYTRRKKKRKMIITWAMETKNKLEFKEIKKLRRWKIFKSNKQKNRKFRKITFENQHNYLHESIHVWIDKWELRINTKKNPSVIYVGILFL